MDSLKSSSWLCSGDTLKTPKPNPGQDIWCELSHRPWARCGGADTPSMGQAAFSRSRHRPSQHLPPRAGQGWGWAQTAGVAHQRPGPSLSSKLGHRPTRPLAGAPSTLSPACPPLPRPLHPTPPSQAPLLRQRENSHYLTVRLAARSQLCRRTRRPSRWWGLSEDQPQRSPSVTAHPLQPLPHRWSPSC